MAVHRRVLVTVLSVVASVLVAPALATSPSAAQEQPQVSSRSDGSTGYRDPSLTGSATRRVRGELRSVADHGGAGDQRIIVTDRGSIVPVTIDLPDAASITPRRITAELAPSSTASAVEPARVAVATIAPAQAERSISAPVDLRARVVVVTNSGPVGSDEQIGRRVDAGLAYWRTEGGSSVSGARRVGDVVRYRSRLKDPRGFSRFGSAFAEAERKVPTLDEGEHLVIVVSRSCDGVGLADVGADLSSSGVVLMADDPAVFTATLAHELGHNVGLEHANLRCTTCSRSLEYFDLYSVMGLAVVGDTPPFEPPALDSPLRRQLGLDEDGEVTTWTPARGESRSFTLEPRGGGSGRRGVEVREGGRSTWIELRDGTGRDAGSYYARADGAVVDDHAYPPGVTLVTRGTDSTRPLDLQEASPGVGSWAAGQVYASRSPRDGDLSVRVDDVGSGRATVTVVRGRVVAGGVDVVGTPRVGQPLRAVRRGWSADTRLTYRWRVDGTSVPGATDATYSPRATDVGRRISVDATGSRPGSEPSSAVTSASTAPVEVGRLSGSVRLDPAPRVGATSRAVPAGFPAGTRLTYEWSVAGTVVPDATEPTFRPTSAQWRRALRVRLVAQAPGYAPSTVSSAPTTVGSGRLAATTPRIAGSRRVGRTLRAVPGRWSPTPTFRYRWYADGRPIAGATSSTLRLTPGLRGKRVSVAVAGRSPAYLKASRRSAPTGAIRR